MNAPGIQILSVMEDVIGESMDMASPFPDHADDFEIDIDIMEEEASNADNDLEVGDASSDVAHSHHGAAPAALDAANEDLHDADMMDEAVETEAASGVQTLSHGGTNQQINDSAVYQKEAIGESEMIEEDYDEDIDAPVPYSQEQHLLSSKDHVGVVDPGQEGTRQERDFNEELTEAHELAPTREQSEVDKNEANFESDTKIDFEKADSDPVTELDVSKYNLHNESYPEDKAANLSEDFPPKTTELHAEAVHTVTEPETEESIPVAHERDGKTQSYKSGIPDTSASGPDRLTAHPIKVYYQDTELSLFPPREGDSSCTFLLEDSGLFHHSLSKIFSSCRQVLGEDVNEGEVLVFEVEQLNVQLNEDVTSISNVTLAQLVQIYLQLCSNEEIHQPEPLFLNLVTKPSLLTEVSFLSKAAEEGKGISEYYSWNNHNYDEAQYQSDENEPTEKEATSEDSYSEHDIDEQTLQPHEDDANTTSNNANIPQSPQDVQYPTTFADDDKNEREASEVKGNDSEALTREQEREQNGEDQSDLPGYTEGTLETQAQLLLGSLPVDESHITDVHTESSLTVASESINDVYASRADFAVQSVNEPDDVLLGNQAIDEEYNQDHDQNEYDKETIKDDSEVDKDYREEFAGNLNANESEQDTSTGFTEPTRQLAPDGTEYYNEQEFGDSAGTYTRQDRVYEETDNSVGARTPETMDNLLGTDDDFFRSPEKNLAEPASATGNMREQDDEDDKYGAALNESEQDLGDLQFEGDISDPDKDEGEIEDGSPNNEYANGDFDVDSVEGDEDEFQTPGSGTGKRFREREDDGDAIHIDSYHFKRSRPS